jgi:hypothetical protein
MTSFKMIACITGLLLLNGCGGEKASTAKEAVKETVIAPVQYIDANVKAERDAKKKIGAAAEKANADMQKAMDESEGK